MTTWEARFKFRILQHFGVLCQNMKWGKSQPPASGLRPAPFLPTPAPCHTSKAFINLHVEIPAQHLKLNPKAPHPTVSLPLATLGSRVCVPVQLSPLLITGSRKGSAIVSPVMWLQDPLQWKTCCPIVRERGRQIDHSLLLASLGLLSCKRLPHPRSRSFHGHPTFNDRLMWDYTGQPDLAQFELPSSHAVS